MITFWKLSQWLWSLWSDLVTVSALEPLLVALWPIFSWCFTRNLNFKWYLNVPVLSNLAQDLPRLRDNKTQSFPPLSFQVIIQPRQKLALLGVLAVAFCANPYAWHLSMTHGEPEVSKAPAAEALLFLTRVMHLYINEGAFFSFCKCTPWTYSFPQMASI